MTVYAVYNSKGVLVAYFLTNIDAYAFLRDNHLFGKVEVFTSATNTFFTTGVNAVALVDVGASTFPA